MRDLRAELRDWDDDASIEWQPTGGDILVGSIRDAGEESVVIEEERTGIQVTMRLDSPQLGGLFELHNPKRGDRVGIKCTGIEGDGAKRFVMVVDRDAAPQNADSADPLDDDDPDGATSDERDFIEQMLAESISHFPQLAFPTEIPAIYPILITMLLLGALLSLCPHWLAGLLR